MNIKNSTNDKVVDKTQPLTRRGAERRLNLLKTAYDLFLQHGYDKVSLDEIIQIAGGSKTSIYQYFHDKKGLFHAVCDYHFSQKSQNFILEYQADDTLKSYLHQTLSKFYHAIQNERDRQFFHLILQQSQSDPNLMQDLNQRWCNEVQGNVQNILTQAHQQQKILCPNPAYSATMFWGIVHDIHWKSLMNLPLNPQQVEAYLEYSLERFLIAHQYQP